MTRLATVALLACVLGPSPASADPVRSCGKNAELSVGAVSERTVQIVLAPLDEQGAVRPAPPSTAFVEQKTQVQWRRRELAGTEDVVVGKMRVTVKPDPLTIT